MKSEHQIGFILKQHAEADSQSDSEFDGYSNEIDSDRS